MKSKYGSINNSWSVRSPKDADDFYFDDKAKHHDTALKFLF